MLACLLLLAGISVSHAATYYVAKTGSDSNPGSAAQPWLTITKAANTLVAGDTVYVKAGTYEEIVRPVNSGTEGNYITYSAYADDTVIIDLVNLRTTFWDAGFVITGKSYLAVSGFQVKNSTGGFGLLAQESSHHINFLDNYTYNSYNSGIASWEGCHDILIEGNEVELACNDGYQECISADRCYNVQVLNNHIHHSGPGKHGGEGIDIKNGSHDCLVRGNYVHHINRLGIYVESWENYLYNVTVDQNIVHNCWNHGIALACEKASPMENITVTNNLCYTNGYAGITVGNWNGGRPKPFNNIKIINNTCYDNGQPWGQVPGSGYGIINMNGASCTNLVIRNNILSQNLKAQLMSDPDCPAVIEYNVIDGLQTPADWLAWGTNYILADPLFVDPANADFHLQSGSPAIDAGVSTLAPDHDLDGNARPVNGVWDIGCYESAGGAPQPPVANFSGNPTSGNPPLLVYFSDLSTNNPTSWSWTFGDGGTSTAQNPSHEYTTANQYTVSLTATNAQGQDTETKTNYITAVQAQDYFCSSLTVNNGTIQSGDHTSVHASDNVYLVVRSAKSGKKHKEQVTYTYSTGLGSLSSLSVTVEGKVSAGTQPQTVYVYNYSTSSWTSVSTGTLTTSDSTVNPTVSNPSQYISGGTVQVRVYTGGTGNTQYDHSTDLVKITAAP